MSIARTKIKGITYLNSLISCSGFTLFTPVMGRTAYLIDMRGEIVHCWQLPYSPAAGAKLLPNGNLLYMGILPDSTTSSIEGAGGILQELNQSGDVVREYRDPYMHHEPIRLTNGNYLVMKWVPLGNDFQDRVQGGRAGTECNGVMYDDMLCEIDHRNKIVWEWRTSSSISPEEIERCVVCPRDTWLHMNGCSETGNGNILVSYAKANQIASIDKNTKSIAWKWDSKGEISHQHCPTELDNGNILIFDNGLHPLGYSTDASRILELNPVTEKIVWAYVGEANGKMAMFFDSGVNSSCQKLENGNILICESVSGRLFEITENGETVWEYVNPYPLEYDRGSSSPVYSAFRYMIDYSGLEGLKF